MLQATDPSLVFLSLRYRGEFLQISGCICLWRGQQQRWAFPRSDTERRPPGLCGIAPRYQSSWGPFGWSFGHNPGKTDCPCLTILSSHLDFIWTLLWLVLLAAPVCCWWWLYPESGYCCIDPAFKLRTFLDETEWWNYSVCHHTKVTWWCIFLMSLPNLLGAGTLGHRNMENPHNVSFQLTL